MKKSTRYQDEDDRIPFHKRRLAEIAGLALWLWAAFSLVALLSYNKADPSWNIAASRPIENWGGEVGAFFADIYLQFIGLASIILVLVPAVWGWHLVTSRRVSIWWVRLAAMMIGLPFLAGLLAGVEAPDIWPIDTGLGGSIGALLHDRLGSWFTPYAFVFLAILVSATSVWMTFGLTLRQWWRIMRTGAMAVMKLVRLIYPKRGVQVEYNDDAGEETPRWKRLLFFWRREEEGWDEDYEEEEEDEPVRPRKKAASIERSAKAETKKTQPSFELPRTERVKRGDYKFPAMNLLSAPSGRSKKTALSESALAQNARLLESVLQDFGVNGEISKIRPGPVVTLYELEPAAGTKSSRVVGLADDISRSMSAVSARIAVIPGRNAIGIELPNNNRETVFLRELLEDESFEKTDAKLPLALGKDIGGAPIIVDLARMPHLLVAGTTGSGKSVAINTMIMSLVYHLTPDQCKFIMIDPKMLELSMYDGIPHLLTPVVTEPGKAVVALKWTVKEMENRYRLMSSLGVRNIEGYNKRIQEATAKKETLTRTVQTGFDPETGKPIFEEVGLDMNPLPFIVVIVDEMADLMIVAGKEIESSIQRLAQMARAAGIHIIMATQRPSVDVITGVIKANFPTRISFQVTSRIDSRTILGEQGAEQLLGHGDMLYMAGGGRITRVHGPFANDKEVEAVVEHLKSQGEPTYIHDVTVSEEDEAAMFGGDGDGEDAELYQQAVAIVLRDKKASTSYIQRCLKLGYNRAARLIERMEREGIVGPANHVGKREVLSR